MAAGVWKAMQWTGVYPRAMRDLLTAAYTRQLDDKCPIPGGWEAVGVEFSLMSVRNALWRNAESELWDSLERAKSGTLLVCDEGLASYQGMHIVCRQTNEKFYQWLEWNRESTMILSPVRSATHVVWCSRLVDMVHYSEGEACQG
jgi:hypothetical protein